MHRYLLIVALAGCGEARFATQPLPELVAAQSSDPPIAVAELALAPGESMIWDVQWHGFTIGRAELVVDGAQVRSRFKTSDLASAVASVDYTLTTVLDRAAARPEADTERLDLDGDSRQTVASFDATSYGIDGVAHDVPGQTAAHTLHSALGALRAWAQPQATAGHLAVLHAGRLFRVDASQPVAEVLTDQRALRIDCRVSAYDGKTRPIALRLWLTATPARTPIRLEITSGDNTLVAELIAS